MKVFVDPTNSNLAAQTGYVTNNIDTGTPPTQVGSAVISQFASGTVPNAGVAIGKFVVADNFATAYSALVGPALTPFQSWQILYFGSTNNPSGAPAADPDGDGQNNMSEFLSGTNPTNAASLFRISSVAVEGNNIRITWTEGAGRWNALQRSASISSGFTDLFTIFTLGSGTNYLDAGAITNRTSSFYRVRLIQ
jgi:hypothetical protein